MKNYDIDRILKPAFKLFLIYNYESVSTSKLEEEIGLTRGAIFFKYKTKEALFKAVIDKYVLDFKPGCSGAEFDNLKDFIDSFLDLTEKRMNTMRSLGIPDIHRAYFSLLYQALKYYPGVDIKLKSMFDNGIQEWIRIIEKAKDSGEIAPSCNVRETALRFRYLYSGMAVEGSFCDGLDVNYLRESYYSLYKELENGK